MKKLLPIFLLISTRLWATDYYVANAGSDGNPGTIGSPWQTISKVNGTTLAAGDHVYFKRGDTFIGALVVSQSGTLGVPITYGAYGTGANPIITGFTTVSAWSNIGTNLWESTSAISTLDLANVVVINGVSIPMGRTPNKSGGYLQYVNHVGNGQITTGLTGTPSYVGAELVFKPNHWIISRDSITAQSLGTLTYTAGTGIPYTGGQAYDGTNNYGFFIQNKLSLCDTVNEWFYNRSTKKLDIYSIGSPTATIQVSSVEILVDIEQHDNITFDNIQFTGANSRAFYITKSKNVTINQCKLDNNYDGVVGVNFGSSNSSSGFLFTLDSVFHTSNHAIDLPAEFSTSTISGNLVRASGVMPGMGGCSDGKYQGINVIGSGSVVTGNEVDSSGYVAIGFRLSNITISNNYIHTYCFIKDDGGGIYFQGAATGNLIQNNTVLNGIGALAGTANGFSGGNGVSSAFGIYLDDASSGTTVYHNTTSNNSNSGIFLHNCNTVSVLNNTSYDNLKNAFVISDNSASTRTGIVVKNNIWYQKDSTGKANNQHLCMAISSIYNDLASILTMDSNYYARPINDSAIIDRDPTTGGGAHTIYSLATWKALYGKDAASKRTSTGIQSTADLSFNYNTTGSNSVQSLPANYVDVTGVAYNGSITLPAYSSSVLIKSPIVHVTGGTYSGINVSGKSNTTYIADGPVTYTSTIFFGNTINVKFDGTTNGFTYSGGATTAFDPGAGNNLYDTLLNWNFAAATTTMFLGDPSPRLFYSGLPRSTVWWGLTLDGFHSYATRIFSGTFQYCPSKLNVSAGLTFRNGDITNDPSHSATKINAHSVYGVKVNHLRVRGMSIAEGDEGMLYISGNSWIEDVYRDSSRGYIERIIIAKLQGLPFDQTPGIRNVRDIASQKYGTVDVRLQNDQLADTGTYKITGGNFYFRRNTSGNKLDDNYVSNAVVLGGMQELNAVKDTCFIDSSLAFNAYTGSGQAGGSSLIKNNSGGNAILITTNNSDRTPGVALPAGLLDANWWAIPGTYLSIGNIGAYDASIPPPVNPCNCSGHFKYSIKH